MLRKRFITALTFSDGILFRTKLFEPDYRYTHNFVDAWLVDEIVVLDVTRPGLGSRKNFFDVITKFSKECFVPLAAGGGIRNLEDVKQFLALGADKVVINTAAIEKPDFIYEVARLYGSQCVIASMDVKKHGPGDYEVFSHFGSKPTKLNPVQWAKQVEELGAGEILLTSIDRDGWLQGYDLDLCSTISQSVNLPILILGGAGNWKHLLEGFTIGQASAVCSQNIYHFTENSIRSAKEYLHKSGILIRTQ